MLVAYAALKLRRGGDKLLICKRTRRTAQRGLLFIMKALKKPRQVWNAEALGADTSRTGIPGSPSSTKKVFEPPKRNTDTCFFTGSAEEIAAQFVDMLDSEHLI